MSTFKLIQHTAHNGAAEDTRSPRVRFIAKTFELKYEKSIVTAHGGILVESDSTDLVVSAPEVSIPTIRIYFSYGDITQLVAVNASVFVAKNPDECRFAILRCRKVVRASKSRHGKHLGEVEMIGLVNHDGARFSFELAGAAPVLADAETVVVTPMRAEGAFGGTGIRDRAFPTHAEFSWRSHNVSTPAGDGTRKLTFKRFVQTVKFTRDDLHGRTPRPGDRVTRAFDGATFEIKALYAQAGAIICDIVEHKPQLRS